MFPVTPACRALCLLLLVAAPSAGLAQQGAREVMAEAMARMMEAMGLFDTDGVQQGGAAAWGSALDVPWGRPLSDPSSAFPRQNPLSQFSRRMFPSDQGGEGWSADWQPSRLEGIWEGRDGELFIIQGNRVRIYSPTVQRVDGLMQIQGDRLALYNPLDSHTLPFEFAESQGRLILRDLSGQLYLYRRLRLDGGLGRAASRPP